MLTSAPEDPLQDELCLALVSCANAATALYRDFLSRWDLTYQQYLVLKTLAASPDSTSTPGAIARTLRIDTSTVTGLLDRMERKGHLVREHDSGDRRRIIVRPAQDSLDVVAHSHDIEACLMDVAQLEPTEIQSLRNMLRTLHGRIQDSMNTSGESSPAPHQNKKELSDV